MHTAVVAIPLASVAQLLTSGDQSSQLLALLAPLFIALAVAVCGAWALRGLSRSWLRRTTTAGGTPGYLASRRLARRRDVVNLMIPLLLAVSVVTFAASATAVSDDWQRSRASAEVGAGPTFFAESSPEQLLQGARRVAPEGRYLAAALVDTGGSDTSRRLFVDTTRLATVAAWDPAWSSSSPAELQRELRPASMANRLGFAGSRVSVAVRDVALHARANSVAGPSYLWLQYVDDQGEQTDVQLGRLRNGVDATLSADVPRCRSRCLVEQIYLTGQASTVTDVNGRLTLAGVTVDGRSVDWRLGDEGAWRAARPFPVSLLDAPVLPEPSDAGLRLRVYLGRLPPGDGPAPPMVSGFARITPSSTPDVVPALATTRTATRSAVGRGSGTAVEYPAGVVVGTAVNGAAVPMRVVERVAALPVLGDEGTLSDLETSLVEFEPAASAAPLVELWAAPGTPASVLDEVRRAGVPLSPQGSLAQTRSELRSSSFSLGLRLFLLVGLATMLLAVFGVFASAVLQSRWRSYEVASLRVVGVPQRSLLRASVLEYVVMLGVAVLLGVLSAYLSLLLVLPSISLGPAEVHDPAVAYDVHWGLVLAVAGTLLLLAVLIAVLVSRRIVRMGRPSTLRWAEEG